MSAGHGKLKLTLAIGDHPATQALKSGVVSIDGVEAEFLSIVPQIAAFRRMVRDMEFDVCELASTTYVIARSFDAKFVALPIFLHRRFHHGEMLVRSDAGIRTPKDLEGKNVGVRAYSVTTGVWTRGVYIEEFGMDNSKVNWFVDDEEHVVQLKLPPNVRQAPAGRSLAAMMAAGELHAGFSGNAGVGREGPPVSGWNAAKSAPAMTYDELIPDPAPLQEDWFRRTRIYPVHGTVVLKESLTRDYPWLATALAEAFQASKDIWLAKWRSGEADTAQDRTYRAFSRFVGDDPLAWGLDWNLPTIDALQRTCMMQGLIREPLPMDRVFHPVPSRIFESTL